VDKFEGIAGQRGELCNGGSDHTKRGIGRGDIEGESGTMREKTTGKTDEIPFCIPFEVNH
jgi:hypothetical protein